VNSLVVRVRKARFSVAPDAQLATVPVLYMTPFDQTGLNVGAAQPLADNIEDLQIAQGVDVNGDSIIEPTEWFFSASVAGPIPLGFTTRALRVTLIGRAASPLTFDPGSFSRPAAEDHAQGGADSFRRRVLTSTVELRNIAGSP
jgi:hypothetical protein